VELEELKVKATGRDILGKQVKQLRAQGITPVHLYGHGTASRALQMDTATLERLLSQAGTSHMLDLTLDKARHPVKVLVREVQRNPINDALLHVDFFQVRMTEEITIDLAVTVVGEPGAKRLIVEHMLHHLSIKCLPGNIPSDVELDISPLAEPGQAILVKDISLGPDVTVLNDPDDIVVRVEAPRVAPVEEVEEEVAEEAVAAEAAKEAPAEEQAPAGEGRAEEGGED
jgi:large subunit ribosomal protein L25